jgi:hypothetical protein
MEEDEGAVNHTEGAKMGWLFLTEIG